jgi:HD superfamily phosphohydrolase
MRAPKATKRKIFNDPVYGFVSIQDDLIFELVEHRYFQRLRRIEQLGLTHLVYPVAVHSRFQHSLGAMHLMQKAIDNLKTLGHDISDDEARSAEIAILLHDIGHGPYSHALEHSIVSGISHEEISRLFFRRFNDVYDGQLNSALQIFEGSYQKKFLTKLVSSQLDMDRLDYLKRDSFFTGVAEGVINYERLLNMLNVVDDGLVIEAKGIYSVEKFITARRLMYWQVYLHKTVLVAEYLLMQLLKRAKHLAMDGDDLDASPTLTYFLGQEISHDSFINDEQVLIHFSNLDDADILSAIKVWKDHPDQTLSFLSKSLLDRRLFRIEMQNEPFDENHLEKVKQLTKKKYHLTEDILDYFVFRDKTSNYAYAPGPDHINILFKDGSVRDIAEAASELNISLLSKPVTKYFLCYPKDVLGS